MLEAASEGLQGSEGQQATGREGSGAGMSASPGFDGMSSSPGFVQLGEVAAGGWMRAALLVAALPQLEGMATNRGRAEGTVSKYTGADGGGETQPKHVLRAAEQRGLVGVWDVTDGAAGRLAPAPGHVAGPSTAAGVGQLQHSRWSPPRAAPGWAQLALQETWRQIPLPAL